MCRLSLAIALFLLAPFASQAAEPIEGFWLTENKRAIIKTRICGEKVCGTMVWIKNPVDDAGKVKLGADGKPLCGTELIGGLKPESAGKWDGGWVLDPRSGDRYSANLRLVSPQKIKLRGYLVLPLLGSSQTWTRVPDDRGGC